MPRLRGRPTIVGAGVVVAASYEARAFGIHSGMGGRRARFLCPDAIVVQPRFSAYSEASKLLFEIFEDTSPLVEGLSLEEAFLDVRGLEAIAGTPPGIAERLRRRVRDAGRDWRSRSVWRGRRCSPRWRAGPPNRTACSSSSPEREADFLRPLPVEALWGVGAVTAERLHAHGIHTIGELGRRDEAELAVSRTSRRTPPPRCRPQPRPAPGAPRTAAALDRHAVGVRQRPKSRSDLETLLSSWSIASAGGPGPRTAPGAR